MQNIFYGAIDAVAGLLLLGALHDVGNMAQLVALFLLAKGTLEIFPALR
jgi:hypothetical protein